MSPSRSLSQSATVLVLAFTLACRSGPAPDGTQTGGRGRIEATWTDSAGTTRFAVPAVGRWCVSDSLLEITAARRDSAIGIVLLAGDSSLARLAAGTYSVMPANVFIPWRPRALAALQLAGTEAVRQYQSGTGQVEVTGVGPEGISGRFELRLVASPGTDSVIVTGEFHRVTGIAAPPPCGRMDKLPG